MGIGVWLIVAFIVIAVIAIIKIANEKQAVALKLLIILFIFFTITAGYVRAKKGVNLKSFEGLSEAFKVYFSWLGQLFRNTKGTVGYAVKQDWAIPGDNNHSQINEIQNEGDIYAG